MHEHEMIQNELALPLGWTYGCGGILMLDLVTGQVRLLSVMELAIRTPVH